MEALVYDGKLRFDPSYPTPSVVEGQSRVRVTRAAICHTDREIMRGYKPGFVGVLGHEFVGVVEASDDPSWVGKRVVGELNEACGACLYCRTGRSHHCEHRKVLGMVQKDGCFAEAMLIASSLLHEVPDEVEDDVAIFCEPLAAALEIPERVHLKPSTAVGVIGDGRLAYMIAQVVALTGAPVTVFGRHEEKLERFRGFASTSLTPEGSFEVMVEASGSPSGLATALALTRSQGTLCLKSTYAGGVEVDMSEVVVREITISGSRCGPFAPALQLLRRKLIELPEVAWFALRDYEAAFQSQALKVGFRIQEVSV